VHSLINAKMEEFLPKLDERMFDAVITDPPYDLRVGDWFNQIMRVSKPSATIIMFCRPEHQFFVPDEYLFWIKTPSTKNYQKKCGRFVEMILVDRGEGSPFNQLHWSQMTGVYDDRLVHPPVHPYP
jgi:16S rRNA G966 N2-methylase RsmD